MSGRPAVCGMDTGHPPAYDARVLWRTGEPVFVEDVEGSTRPAAYYLAESRDGLYVPYVVRTPADEGRFPFVFLAYGNGGRAHHIGHVQAIA